LEQTSLTVQGLLSSQAPVRFVPRHVPLAQVSLTVHGFRSSHAPVEVVPAQVPVGEQVSLMVQLLKSLQGTAGDVPVQVPFMQVPTTGHPNPTHPSERHAVPFGRVVPEPHTPVVGLHTPTTHGLSARKKHRGKPWHTPASTHRSPWVQMSLSLQGVPASTAAYTH
jgi:hypothetical protein